MANYVITDGTRWIMKDRNGKYVPTSCESFADIFSKKQAENIQKCSFLNGLASDALRRKEELNQKLSNIDKEICDLLHYIEFCNLNAAQGYKVYKMLKERRIIRRSIKNELNVLNIILSKKISETATDEINKCVAGMDKRTYEPRVLKELFDF